MVIITIKREINGKTFIGSCKEEYLEILNSFLEIIKDININEIKNDYKIQFGFSMYSLFEENNCFHIMAPAYFNSPLVNKTKDLSLSFQILQVQVQFLKFLDLGGENIFFQDKIVFSEGILDKKDFYMERSESPKGDTGWFIGFLEKNNEDLKAILAYELLELKPDIIMALGLPSGYLVVFKNNKIDAILDSSDKYIYRNKDSENGE